MDALLAILLLKPLLECFWVFSNPVKVPSVDLSSNFQNSKSSFLCCACLHTFSTPSWRSIFSSFTEHSTVLSSCALMHFARCPPGRALRILSDSGLPSNSQQSSSFSVHHCTHAQCPLGRAPTESSSDSVCNCVLTHTALPPEVFNNLTGLLPELLTSVLCLSTSLSDSSEFRSALMHWYSESATLCHALLT
jgi:hypothetical protein